jgi:hypothetical protein
LSGSIRATFSSRQTSLHIRQLVPAVPRQLWRQAPSGALDAPPRSTAAAKRVRTVIQRYLKFAHDNPATYEAMFSMPTDLPFATSSTPAPLRQGFAAIQRMLADSVDDPETATEMLWSAMHGLADLQRHARLRPSHRANRVELLTRLFGDDAAQQPLA